MKRTELARKTPLRPGAPPKRTGRLASKTTLKAKGKPRFKHGRDPAWCAYIRTLPCCVPVPEQSAWMGKLELGAVWPILLGYKPCSGPIECAHVVSRGAGGVDRGNTVPMCRTHHRHQHAVGIQSFQAMYQLDLPALASSLAALGEPGRAA